MLVKNYLIPKNVFLSFRNRILGFAVFYRLQMIGFELVSSFVVWHSSRPQGLFGEALNIESLYREASVMKVHLLAVVLLRIVVI